jgi:hypothetical protein
VTIRTPSSAPPGQPDESPEEPRYPWQLFVGMLAAILFGGAVLGLLMGVNPLTFQKLAPEPQTTPIVTAAPVSAPPASTALPLAPATSAPTPPPAATPVPAPTAAPTTATIAPAGAVQAPPTVGTGPTSSTGSVPQSTTTATSTEVNLNPSVPEEVDAHLANIVLDAYMRYWDARARATGDPFAPGLDEQLAGVMAGVELAKAQQSVLDFRLDGRLYLVHADHEIELQRVTTQEALLVDRFTATAQRIDPDTRLPVNSPPVVEQRRDAFLLRPIEGTWKVVEEPET